ncbi:hypothetical protein Bint_2223 [Brachyspira intermedia PWS/A]|uniref:Uncharacterized protein n=1 Tax=Brachyspira intermedia (strain ATCC 51140 / PWS/A) TaxID=1045858 RepID=G0ELY2_BRAIP|nr:hypothetical protein Bint_2223 [Brachyspira intermedia PWS/A]
MMIVLKFIVFSKFYIKLYTHDMFIKQYKIIIVKAIIFLNK